MLTRLVYHAARNFYVLLHSCGVLFLLIYDLLFG